MALTARWWLRTRPGVLVLAGQTVFHGAVLRHGDRHVQRRRLIAPRVGQREPLLHVAGLLAGAEKLAADEPRAQRQRFHAAGQDGGAHARCDLPGAYRDGRQARGALPVDGHAGDLVQAQVDGDVAGAVAAALQTLGEHQVVEIRRGKSDRSMAADTIGLANSTGGMFASVPLRAVPIAVRAAATIAALLCAAMLFSQNSIYVRGESCNADRSLYR